MLKAQPNKFNQKLSASSVSGLMPTSEVMPSSSSIQCSENWMKMQQNLKLDEKQNQKRILSYVKDYLFKDLEFIPSPEMMTFSNKMQSHNYLVCKAHNIKEKDQWCYWAKYAACIEKSLNARGNLDL